MLKSAAPSGFTQPSPDKLLKHWSSASLGRWKLDADAETKVAASQAITTRRRHARRPSASGRVETVREGQDPPGTIIHSATKGISGAG
jgi:hypothetical protein